MAKAILEFDLNDFDDKNSFKIHTKGLDAHLALWDIIREADNLIKAAESRDEECAEIEDFRTRIYNILEYHNIDLDGL